MAVELTRDLACPESRDRTIPAGAPVDPASLWSQVDQLLRDLSSNHWPTRRDAVGRCEKLLRTSPDGGVLDRLAPELERLARDHKHEVRRGVALALEYLEHERSNPILESLLGDCNYYVKRGAERALERRRRAARQEEKREKEVGAVARELERLRARFSEDVAERAIKVGRTYYELAAASAAHDILNVLTAMDRSLDLAQAAMQNPEIPASTWREHIELARRRSKTIQSIAIDMKLFAENSEPTFRKENLREIVLEALGLVHERFKTRLDAPRVCEEVSVERHLVLDAPRVRLVQAFTNIFKNGYEAIRGEGQVSISAKIDACDLVVRVTDNGCGMSPSMLKAAFQPGVSTKKSLPGRTDNTGMGLSIAQKIVEGECKGEVLLESQPGAGTTVTVRLPREQKEKSE